MECEDFPRNQKMVLYGYTQLKSWQGEWVLGECTIHWATKTDTSETNEVSRTGDQVRFVH